MAFLLFRPSFWLVVGWIFVWTYYVDAGMVVDSVDKEFHARTIRNASRSTTTEKWNDKDPTLPSSSHTIFPTAKVTWLSKFQLLTIMLISGMSAVPLAFSS